MRELCAQQMVLQQNTRQRQLWVEHMHARAAYQYEPKGKNGNHHYHLNTRLFVAIISSLLTFVTFSPTAAVKCFVENLRLGFPLMVTTLLTSTGDWRATVRIIAGLTALMCALCIAFFHDNPAALGLQRDGDDAEEKIADTNSDPKDNDKQSKQNVQASDDSSDSDTTPAKEGLTIREALLTPKFQVVLMVNVIVSVFEPALNIHGKEGICFGRSV